MQNILDATVKEARATGQRKMSPAHLCVDVGQACLSVCSAAHPRLPLLAHRKRAVHNNETFDFLKAIVETVKDDGDATEPKAKKRRTAKGEDSD